MIKLPRGNSAVFTLTLTNADGTPFVPSENDTVIFTVQKSQVKDAPAIIVKKITPSNDMTMTISFEPSDTVNLPEGDYFYDVSVCIGGSNFYTVVHCDNFKITPTLGELEMMKYAKY